MNASGHRPAIVIALLLGAATSVDAHHSWARYDNDAVVTITGVVTRLEWASPHVFVYFEGAEQDQQPVAWTMELDPPVLLRRYGVAREMLEEGVRIVVTGVRARNGAPMMRGLHIVLEDGTHVRVSSRV
jgi:hypothetical protein